MIMLFGKVEGHQLTENLNTRELDCKCSHDHCNRTLVHADVAPKFEELRSILGDIPLTITSGFRCSHHNYDVGGKDLSRHTAGMAIDIKCPDGVNFERFYRACCAVFPFTLAYRNLKFCHCDIDRR